jgi:hypothetical protein
MQGINNKIIFIVTENLFCETKVIANNVIKNVGKVGFTF